MRFSLVISRFILCKNTLNVSLEEAGVTGLSMTVLAVRIN